MIRGLITGYKIYKVKEIGIELNIVINIVIGRYSNISTCMKIVGIGAKRS